MSMDRVCTYARSVTVSRTTAVFINGNIGYRLSYVQGYVSVLGCCSRFFTEVGNSCKCKYMGL